MVEEVAPPHRYRPDNLNSLCTATGSVHFHFLSYQHTSIHPLLCVQIPLSLFQLLQVSLSSHILTLPYFWLVSIENGDFIIAPDFKRIQYLTFFHHYQGSIDFNIVNIHPNEEMYFFVPTGNRDDIE